MSLRPTLILSRIKSRLEKVVREDADPCTTRKARTWLVLVEHYTANPHLQDDVPAWFGFNGYGPAIDSVCKDAEIFARMNAEEREKAA